MKKLRHIVLLMFCAQSLLAQDIHFSQFNSSPQNLNPAQTGLFDGDWRFAGNYRSQWAAIPVPYRTYSISADTRIKTKLANDVPAAGLIINTDKAGDSKFSTTQIFLSGAYIKKLNKDSSHFLSLAIQPGITTRSFNVNALTFDEQWDGDSYNAAMTSGESFSKTRVTYADLGAGLAYLWRKTSRTQMSVGVSALHLNRPKQSFFNNDDIRLDVKMSVNAIAQFPVSAKLDVIPTIFYQRQGKFQETVPGVFGKYYLNPVNGATTAVSLGGFYRLKDAFILCANMDYRNFNVGLSYDVNTSKLNEATNSRGGFEISVIYIFKKAVPFVAKKRVCPIYM
ncbi:MAG: PorP/SprF family type IX secretion system membrane protein [Bacteroidota bacterium]|nr:PorP/SprF family type IX secretion system membrane protein [Bacteroidota bacterium]